MLANYYDNMRNLIARQIPGGFTWTLTTYALKYLMEAEKLFGEKTNEYAYIGVELAENGPQVWYPFGKYIVIQVSPSTAFDEKQAIFQIAHEIVHVLSPNGNQITNNLEEGLATYFSKMVTDRDTQDSSYAIGSIETTKFLKPFKLVEKLLNKDFDAIKKLRIYQPVIGNITKQNFIDAEIILEENIINELIEPMKY